MNNNEWTLLRSRDEDINNKFSELLDDFINESESKRKTQKDCFCETHWHI